MIFSRIIKQGDTTVNLKILDKYEIHKRNT